MTNTYVKYFTTRSFPRLLHRIQFTDGSKLELGKMVKTFDNMDVARAYMKDKGRTFDIQGELDCHAR